jgi:hypothetical protein
MTGHHIFLLRLVLYFYFPSKQRVILYAKMNKNEQKEAQFNHFLESNHPASVYLKLCTDTEIISKECQSLFSHNHYNYTCTK